jgi:hypothetical protein
VYLSKEWDLWVAESPLGIMWMHAHWSQADAFAFALDHATGAMR